MNQAYKQRLVGGIVLLSLALIFIPTILDFSQDEPAPATQREEMPEAPDVMKMEVMPLEIWSERTAPQVDTDSRIVEMPSAVKETVEQNTATAPVPAPAKSAPEQPKQSKPAASPAVVKAEPKPATKPAVTKGADAWVVQVASFSDEPNAFKLRDRLRTSGITSFIERSRGDAGLIYRVKVGPVLRKSEADQLKKQISQQLKLDGLVMPHH